MAHDEALLFILGKAPAGDVESFNEWYDEDHVPPRLAVPGISKACRYSDNGVDNDAVSQWDVGDTGLQPAVEMPFESNYDPGTYLSYYDLRSLDVLESDGYRNLSASATERERAMQKVCRFDRRVYRSIPAPAITNDEDAAICGEFLVCVWWTPVSADDGADNRWVDEQYLPRLMSLPGWLRARRFERVTGPGPQYLALFDVESLEAFRDGTYNAAVQTIGEVMSLSSRTASATRLLRLHRQFAGVDAA